MKEKNSIHGSLDPGKLQVVSLLVRQGRLDCPEEYDSEELVGFAFDVGLKLGFDWEGYGAYATLHFDIATESSKSGHKAASALYILEYSFEVKNLHELAQLEDSHLEIHPDLLTALAAISYSTSRGVLMTRLQGTALERFILPVISPSDLVDQAAQKAKG